ncbi:MAG: hypothetical protein M3347_16065, partial [Armatimonadota bacterium]|nr:hypothetical protein [Armatimonadota bacterium]
FQEFEDKSIHVVVDDTPDTTQAWTIENFQRDCIIRGLANCRPDDIILMSDIDEIPRASKVLEASQTLVYRDNPLANFYHAALKPRWTTRLLRKLLKRRHPFIKIFLTRPCSYFLNCVCDTVTWPGTRMLHFRDWTTGHELRRWGGAPIEDGGWHFFFMGGVDKILQKLNATPHQELNTPENSDPQRIAALINQGADIFGGTEPFKFIEIDDTYPAYIVQNQDKFADWIKD